MGTGLVLFWLRRLDRYSTINTILDFHCETAREVPLQGMGSMLNYILTVLNGLHQGEWPLQAPHTIIT